MAQVWLWVVEASELKDSAWSCVPRQLPSGVQWGTCAWFDSERDLVKALVASVAGMHQRPDGGRHLLVISTHGKERTGTRLAITEQAHVSLDQHVDLFAIRPKGLVILISACWGGYPSVIRAVRAGNAKEHALVIAPLVKIHPDDINAVQHAVLEAMTAPGPYDDVIERLVVAYDEELQEKHAEPVLRVVRRDGSMLPAEGDAGLADRMEETACYRVVALQRLPQPNTEPPAFAVVQEPRRGTYWRVPVTAIADAATEDTVHALHGDVVVLRGKRLRYSEVDALGELVDVVRMARPTEIKVLPMQEHRYAHSTERTTAMPADQARVIKETSLKRCKRCNWASLTFESESRGGKTRHGIEGLCHRPRCPEHDKWLK